MTPLIPHKTYSDATMKIRMSKKKHGEQLVFGDASASTFWQAEHRNPQLKLPRRPFVPVVIRAMLPAARLIVTLRNPVSAALFSSAHPFP